LTLRSNKQDHFNFEQKSDASPRWSSMLSDGLTLSTFHVGSIRTLVVLQDWIDFFEPHITRIRVVTSTDYPGCFTEAEFYREFPNAELIVLASNGQTVPQLDCMGVMSAIANASTEWVALVKLDTLPFRANKEADWLEDAVANAASNDCWAITALASHRCRCLNKQFSLTQSFSQNMAIVARSRWRDLFQLMAPELYSRVISGTASSDDRYLMEDAIERGLQRFGMWNLRLVDRHDFSVFHINQWEDALLRIRDQYRSRIAVKRFLNGPAPLTRPIWKYPSWKVFYGLKPPPLRKRLRAFLGRLRLKIRDYIQCKFFK
jgi:hypothetical protein